MSFYEHQRINVWMVWVTFTWKLEVCDLLTPRLVSDMPYWASWESAWCQSFQLGHLLPSGRSNGWKQSCMQMNSWCRQRRLVSPKLMSQGNIEMLSFWEEREGEGVWNKNNGSCNLHTVCIINNVAKGRPKNTSCLLQLQTILTSSASVKTRDAGGCWGCKVTTMIQA